MNRIRVILISGRALAAAALAWSGALSLHANVATTATVGAGGFHAVHGQPVGLNSTHVNSTGNLSFVESQDPLYLNALAKVRPRLMRYPGGTTGNFWNYTSEFEMGANYNASGDSTYTGSRPGNLARDFRDFASDYQTTSGLKPYYFVVLNMLSKPTVYPPTSNPGANEGNFRPLPVPGTANWNVAGSTWDKHLTWQAKLFTPAGFGAGNSEWGPNATGLIVYVELGNEFYDSSSVADNDEHYTTYQVYPRPTAGTTYAMAAHFFIKNLKQRIIANGGPDFTNPANTMKFAVVGCQERWTRVDSTRYYTQYNQQISDYFRNSVSLAVERPHAYVFHEYFTNALSTGEQLDYTNEQSDVLQEVWKRFNYIQARGPDSGFRKSEFGWVRHGDENGNPTPSKNGNNSGELWFSEYNVAASGEPIQGLWGHGLAVGLMVSRFFDVASADYSALSDQHILLHADIGGADTSAILATTGKLTAAGAALSLAYEAACNGGTVAPINFSGVTPGGEPTDTIPNLHGVVFDVNGHRRALIVNTSNTVYNVTMNATSFPKNANGYYRQIDTPVNVLITDGASEIITTNAQPSTLTCPSYSLTLTCYNP